MLRSRVRTFPARIPTARASTIDDFRLKFDNKLEGFFIDRMDGNVDIFQKVMEDQKFRAVAGEWLLNEVYRQIRQQW